MLIPLLMKDLVENYTVISDAEFTQLVSLAQITPGPIGINTATYIGFQQFGIMGGILASIALILPSFFLVLLALHGLKRYQHTVLVEGILTAMRPAALALVFIAIILFAQRSLFSGDIPGLHTLQEILGVMPNVSLGVFQPHWIPLIICVATIIIQLKTKISFLLILAGAAILGAIAC